MLPGYLGGSLVYRCELAGQRGRIRALALTSAVGAAAGAALLLVRAIVLHGGYFGAGLGIMLLAVLGVFLNDDLQRLNALKGVLSLLIAVVTVLGFALFGPIAWDAALVVGAACLVGSAAGVHLARRSPADVLRAVVIAYGVGVAIVLLV